MKPDACRPLIKKLLCPHASRTVIRLTRVRVFGAEYDKARLGFIGNLGGCSRCGMNVGEIATLSNACGYRQSLPELFVEYKGETLSLNP